MSNYILISPLLVDLSSRQQQIIMGGNNNSPTSENHNNIFGDGFPNQTDKTPFLYIPLGDGFPKPPNQNPFNVNGGANGAGNGNDKINSHQNNIGTILY